MGYGLASSLLLLLLPYFQSVNSSGYVSPLASFSPAWNNPKYKDCNAAKSVDYMDDREKEVIYILNLARVNPRLFAETVVKNGYKVSSFIDTNDVQYFRSLIATMDTMRPRAILRPDAACVESARCHAISAGKKGYVGHKRQSESCKRKEHYYGECCNYGADSPIETVLSLLIDSGVPNLGHRKICLGEYAKVGAAVARHANYKYNTVIDFY